MIKRILFSALAASIVISACHTTKKTTAKVVDTEPAFQLDTVSVVANEVPKKEIYQESNPRTNDIIHTKLEVNFDWANSKMNGKARIEIKPYFHPTNKLFLNARGMDIKSMNVYLITSIPSKKKEGNKEKVVLTGTYESSYGKFKHMRANRSDNKKINLNIIKLFFKKIKK